MIAVIERGTQGEGGTRVAWAHWVLAGLCGLGAVQLARLLYRAIRANAPDDGTFGISVVLGVLLALMLFHILTARAALRQKRWARTATRVVAFFLFPAFPIGTAFAWWLLSNTSVKLWAPSPAQPEKSNA